MDGLTSANTIAQAARYPEEGELEDIASTDNNELTSHQDQKQQKSCFTRLINSVTIAKPLKDSKAYRRRYKLFLMGLLTLCASIDPIASTSFYRQCLFSNIRLIH